jgi:hypothetical protein
LAASQENPQKQTEIFGKQYVFLEGFFMKPVLSNFQINGFAAPVGATLPAAFGPVAIATRLLVSFGFRGRIDSPLNNRRTGLGHNLGRGLGDRVLWQGVRYRGRWQGRNLHGYPRAFSRIRVQLLRIQGEKTINHSVRVCVLDKCLKRLNKCLSSTIATRKAG